MSRLFPSVVSFSVPKKLQEQNEALEQQNRILKEELASCQIRVKELEEEKTLVQSSCLVVVSYLLFQQGAHLSVDFFSVQL